MNPMAEFINPAFMHVGASSKPLTPTPMSPAEAASHQKIACVSPLEPNNQPKQEKMSPIISDIKMPCNCGGGGWNTSAHHCAKLFQLNVHISNLCSKPTVEIPKQRNFEGDYKSRPGRLQCRMTFTTPSGAEKETLLNLGVATIMSNSAEVMSPHALEKLRVGLQYCKVGADKQVQLEWIADANGQTGTAVIKFKVRARRVRQHEGTWELKDDAGSGIRGKPHDSSAFRFWACLQHSGFSLDNSKPVDEIIQAAIQANSGTYKSHDVRVWSKGNCPAKTRKISPRSGKKQQVQAAPMLALQQQIVAQNLPFLPVPMNPIPMPAVMNPNFQLSDALNRGTKRPTLFTNLPLYNNCSFTATCPMGSMMQFITSPPAQQQQQQPPKRVRYESYLASDDIDLGLMADNLCGGFDTAEKNTTEEIDEIESIINSLQDDDTDNDDTKPDRQAAWSPLGFDVDDLDRSLDHLSATDLILSVCEPVC